MHRRSWTVAVGAFFVLAAAWAWADGKIAESEVPKAVMQAVSGVVPDAKFISGETGTDHNRMIYKLNVKDKMAVWSTSRRMER